MPNLSHERSLTISSVDNMILRLQEQIDSESGRQVDRQANRHIDRHSSMHDTQYCTSDIGCQVQDTTAAAAARAC